MNSIVFETIVDVLGNYKFIREAIHELFNDFEFDASKIHEKIKSLENKVAELDIERQFFIKSIGKGRITAADIDFQLENLELQKSELTNNIQKFINQIGLNSKKREIVDYIKAFQDTMNKSKHTRNEATKREILLACVERIYIDYVNGNHIIQINNKYPLFEGESLLTMDDGINASNSRNFELRYADGYKPYNPNTTTHMIAPASPYLQSYNPTQYKYLIIPIIVNVSDKSMVLKKGYLK